MTIKNIFAGFLITLFLVGCENMPIQPYDKSYNPVDFAEHETTYQPDTTTSKKFNPKKDCNYIYRDLTVKWKDRKYWCRPQN